MLGLFNKCDEDPIEVDLNIEKESLAFKEVTQGRKPNLYYLNVLRFKSWLIGSKKEGDEFFSLLFITFDSLI